MMDKYQRIEQERLGYGPGTWRKKMKKIKAAIVVLIASLYGMACGVPGARGHHVDGDCYGFVVFDSPFVTPIGTFDVGSHEWPDGVSSLSGTQNNGSEQSSASKPDDCVVVTTTTQGGTTSTSTTPTTSATTTTTVSGTTTSVPPPTTPGTQPPDSSTPVVKEPPPSSPTSPTTSTVPPKQSVPTTGAPILPPTE